jgi:hypothetical protein
MSVFYFKLNSGEDIVATVVKQNPTNFEITKVLLIKQSFDPDTRTLYSGFYIWIPFKEYLENVSKVPVINVMLFTPVVGSMLDEYIKYIDYVKKEMPENEMDIDESEFDEDEEEQVVVPKSKVKRVLN